MLPQPSMGVHVRVRCVSVPSEPKRWVFVSISALVVFNIFIFLCVTRARSTCWGIVTNSLPIKSCHSNTTQKCTCEKTRFLVHKVWSRVATWKMPLGEMKYTFFNLSRNYLLKHVQFYMFLQIFVAAIGKWKIAVFLKHPVLNKTFRMSPSGAL